MVYGKNALAEVAYVKSTTFLVAALPPLLANLTFQHPQLCCQVSPILVPRRARSGEPNVEVVSLSSGRLDSVNSALPQNGLEN